MKVAALAAAASQTLHGPAAVEELAEGIAALARPAAEVISAVLLMLEGLRFTSVPEVAEASIFPMVIILSRRVLLVRGAPPMEPLGSIIMRCGIRFCIGCAVELRCTQAATQHFSQPDASRLQKVN